MRTELLVNITGIVASTFGALVGGRIAGRYALLAVKKTFDETRALEKEQRDILVKAFLKSVYDEISVVWELYQRELGPLIEPLADGEPLMVHYPLTQDYFTVYNSNAALIGHIEDSEIRTLIIQVYARGRGLIDSYKFNNEMLVKYENLCALFNDTQKDVHNLHAQITLDTIRAYAAKLKLGHFELKSLTNKLLDLLRKSGIDSQPRHP